nr:MAG TPA: hypothetical protein [Caudoviricetes sp.]
MERFFLLFAEIIRLPAVRGHPRGDATPVTSVGEEGDT